MKEPFLPGQYYHVFHHAVGNLNLFRDDRDYRTFLSKYTRFLGDHLSSYAYCLMPNHFHMLIRVTSDKARAEEVLQRWSNFLNSYAQSYNRKYQLWGRVFQQGLPRTLIPDEDTLVTVMHYIHFNPVKHGFTTDAWRWTYNSLSALASEAPTRLERGEVLKWFGGKAEFRRISDAWELPEQETLNPKWFLEE
ncbi:MAG: hypothetical protein AAFQ98_14075 [Bacteroidota bacterium]